MSLNTDPLPQRFYGLYRGVVWNTNDPENLGRLQLRIPAVLDNEVSDWAFPCFPPNWRQGVIKPDTDPQGGTITHSLIDLTPSVGSTVWVMFEKGDSDHPVWIGTP